MAPSRFRRIVVALDASTPSVTALEVAVRLAARLEAELAALHVVDAGLAGLAEHPLVHEVDFFSGRPRPIRARRMERQLVLFQTRAREALERAVGGLDLSWSFHTARGRPPDELLGFAGDADLVVLGVRGRSRGRGLGSTARALAGRQGLALVVVAGAAGRDEVIHVLHDGTAAGDEAVRTASALRPPGSPDLVVLTWDPGGGPGRLPRALRQAAPGLLVVPRSAVSGKGFGLSDLLRHGRCPVLVVG